MVSTFTTNKNIEKPGHNDYPNTWDVPVNADWDLIDKTLGGSLLLNATGLSGTQALTITQTQAPTIQISGVPTAAITYTVPTGVGGLWLVRNTTTGGFPVGFASAAGGTTLTVLPNGVAQMWCDGTATGMQTADVPRNFLSGLDLSNSGSAPNTTINVAVGSAADSTNSVLINIPAVFSKTTGSPWVAGTGNAGMGVGLTVTANTWYPVFVIINAGRADIYFDSALSGARAPAGTTALRYIGDIKTDASGNILQFIQNNDNVNWVSAITENPVAGTNVLSGVPPYLVTTAKLGIGFATGVAFGNMAVSTPGAASLPQAGIGAGNATNAIAYVDTDNTGSVTFAYSGSVGSNTAATLGYTNRRLR